MPHDGSMIMPPGSMSGSGNSISSTSSMDMTMHMNFYWGKHVVILFSGWPGHSLAMYIIALCFVFFLGFAIEVLSVSPQVREGANSMNRVFLQASVHAVRMVFAYMVMLSVMSYNLGVFIVAVAGHTAGFLLVKARALAAANRADPMSPTVVSNCKVRL